MNKVYRKICLIIPKTPILICDLLINVIFVVFSHDDSHKVKKPSKKDLSGCLSYDRSSRNVTRGFNCQSEAFLLTHMIHKKKPPFRGPFTT